MEGDKSHSTPAILNPTPSKSSMAILGSIVSWKVFSMPLQ